MSRHELEEKDKQIANLERRLSEKNEQLAEYRDKLQELKEISKIKPFLSLFNPIVFDNQDEFYQAVKKHDVRLHGSGRIISDLRAFGGHMYRKENVKSALYYLKIPKMNEIEMEKFTICDEFEHVKDNLYTWKNGNINALYVVEQVEQS